MTVPILLSSFLPCTLDQQTSVITTFVLPRAADPVAMKEFVVAVHARAGEAGGTGRLTKRAQILLELVVDVKNNR